MTTNEILFYEFLAGLVIAWIGQYVAERFDRFLKELVVFMIVAAVVMIPVVMIMPEGNSIQRILLFVAGIFFGIRGGRYSYKLRNLS